MVMLGVQTLQWRRRCQMVACRRLIQAGTRNCGRVRRPAVQSQSYLDIANISNSNRCYSNYSYSDSGAPTTFSSLNIISYINNKEYCHRRSFSKVSSDEVVIQDPDPPPASSPKTAAAITSTSSSTAPKIILPSPTLSEPIKATSQDLPPQQKIRVNDHVVATTAVTRERTNNNKLVTELQDAHELFHRIYTESQALLRNNQSATSSDEVVAMADYFLIKCNSLDLEKHLEIVQTLQNTFHDEKAKGEKQHEEEGAVKEKLRLANKSMSQLHHVFLTMVEKSLPLNPAPSTQKEEGHVESPFDEKLYSAITVGRALQLSRRAEELGLPIHRPLYQRLASGVVLTSHPGSSTAAAEPSSSHVSPSSVDQESTDAATDTEAKEPTVTAVVVTEPASLILPGQFEQSKEGLNTPPLSLELLGILQHARLALRIIAGEQLQQLAEDILVGPFLLLLKSRQWKEAMGLLHGWRALFGQHDGGKIDLISLMGENHTLDALEIAKGWLVSGTEFEEDVQTDPHAIALTGLLEVAVREVIKGRKQRAERIARLLSQVSIRNDDDDFNGENDSDTEYEVEVDYDYDTDDDDDEEEFDTPMPVATTEFSTTTTVNYTPSDGSPVVLGKGKIEPLHFSKSKEDDVKKDTIIVPLGANDDAIYATHKMEKEQGEEEVDESYTIIEGMGNKEARKSIYLRNGTEWILPDVVSQLVDWNKGNQLSFTPEFERYLGKQIMKDREAEELDEDY